jgi:uncharacterized protein YndB with AHSA1/START domain
MSPAAPALDVSIQIGAPAGRVLKAFFDPDALGAWWQVSHAVVKPRALGPFVVEWAPTDFRDAVLGRLGGVFSGRVMQFDPGAGFFVADAYWLPPDGDPIGPMALEVTCTPAGTGTRVRVTQNGFEESERWRRYYEVIGVGWERALASLKSLLEP